MKQNPDKHSDPAMTQVPAPILYLTLVRISCLQCGL